MRLNLTVPNYAFAQFLKDDAERWSLPADALPVDVEPDRRTDVDRLTQQFDARAARPTRRNA